MLSAAPDGKPIYLRLPCLPGDRIWTIIDGRITSPRVQGISIVSGLDDVMLHLSDFSEVFGDDLGQRWFLTEDAAKAACEIREV